MRTTFYFAVFCSIYAMLKSGSSLVTEIAVLPPSD